MKKKAIVILAFAAALTAVSCQKEAMKEAETTPTGEGMTISAVTEGIGADVKADLAYKYDVIWRTGDKICVKNSEKKSVEFTLTGGVGTTKGTFSSDESISGEVEGFYPASVADLIWPAEQQNNHVPPMYCKKNLTSTQNQTFNFASLGSVLQLNFNSTTADIVLKSIEVKANEAMSGAFTIDEEGKAVISQPEGDKPGITLELGEGVTLGTSAKKFNIAVPAGEYHGLSIVFTATNGTKCTINAKKDKAIKIVFNTVNTLAVSGEFKPDLPAGALKGVFSVSATKKVHFSQGNLVATIDANGAPTVWKFAANQYDNLGAGGANKTIGANAGDVDLFGWSTDATSNNWGIHTKTSATAGFTTGNFKDWGANIDDKGTWRTLSTAEWQYLFNTSARMVNGKACYSNAVSGVTIGGSTYKGVFLYPDNYNGEIVSSSMTWNDINAAGIVFLPAAGRRLGSDVHDVGDDGRYWSSSAIGEYYAYNVYFSSFSVSPDSLDDRNRGFSVRLITESK